MRIRTTSGPETISTILTVEALVLLAVLAVLRGGAFQQAIPSARTPLRALTARGLDNVVAFTRLLGRDPIAE